MKLEEALTIAIKLIDEKLNSINPLPDETIKLLEAKARLQKLYDMNRSARDILMREST